MLLHIAIEQNSPHVPTLLTNYDFNEIYKEEEYKFWNIIYKISPEFLNWIQNQF